MNPSVRFETAEAEMFFEDYEPQTSWADFVEKEDEAEKSDVPIIPSWAISRKRFHLSKLNILLLYTHQLKFSNVCRSNTYSACIFRKGSSTKRLKKPDPVKSKPLGPQADAILKTEKKSSVCNGSVFKESLDEQLYHLSDLFSRQGIAGQETSTKPPVTPGSPL